MNFQLIIQIRDAIRSSILLCGFVESSDIVRNKRNSMDATGFDETQQTEGKQTRGPTERLHI